MKKERLETLKEMLEDRRKMLEVLSNENVSDIRVRILIMDLTYIQREILKLQKKNNLKKL